ncbi:hypothetical protein PZC41_14285 [Staphylococcus aureus]|uniref:hypothetical protein n=1 Tax=Staphylococcus aureus TaxID=1280 RepID=UPI0023B201ED|nr:hypothetical protein [Staphylococcus aureus]MDE8535473.1 hypothetical protein [Staphylococcus aureus]
MASGDTLLVFTPLANEPPAANYATLDSRNAHPVLDFDSGGAEIAIFSGVMPRNYAGGGVTVYVHTSFSSATTGNYKAQASFERIGDSQQDIDSDGFASAQTTADTAVPGTSGHVDIVAITFTDGAQMDSVAVGEGFRLKIEFPQASASNATGDRELNFVELKET